jgi:hypothetical protein
VGFSETVRFPGGADDQAWSVGELREVLEAVGVGWEVVRDAYFWQFREREREGTENLEKEMREWRRMRNGEWVIVINTGRNKV